MAKFSSAGILQEMESLRLENGAFLAAPSAPYRALWWRDMFYCALAYLHIEEYEKFTQTMRLFLDYLKTECKTNMMRRAVSPTGIDEIVFYAKIDPVEIRHTSEYKNWPHYQLDVLGLFLHIVADAIYKNVPIFRDESDEQIVQLVVLYLRSIEYWKSADFGMWEECKIRHSSSIGAISAGLNYLKGRDVNIIVEDSLIKFGQQAVWDMWPLESPDSCQNKENPNHGPDCSHDCDSAQLFLIWPLHFIEKREEQDALISRLVKGHVAANGQYHCLLQENGLQRYWGDNYYRSDNGVSAPWTEIFFELSIIYSQRHEYDTAKMWCERGRACMTDNKVPEAFKNGMPNEQMPLGWGQALALIALTKLPADMQKAVSK